MAFKVSCLFVLCGVLTIVLGCMGDYTPAPKDKFGPYTSTLVRMEKCKKPALPYQKGGEKSGQAVLVLYDTDDSDDRHTEPLIKGNYTSFKEDTDLKFNCQDYQQEKGEWVLYSSMTGMNCYSHTVAKMARAFNIRYNLKTCAVRKGVHKFDGIGYDELDHQFQSIRVYGKTLRRVAVTRKNKTVACYEFEAEVAPQD